MERNGQGPLRTPLRCGLWVCFLSPYGLEIALESHIDWVGLDLQHGDIGSADIPGLLRVTERVGVPAFVRVASHDPQQIAYAIDSGADGVIVPSVESAEQAADLAKAALIPPRGSRSTGAGRRHAIRGNRIEPALLLPMVETASGFLNADDILAVDGVDGVFVGPYDLTLSMGFPNPSSSETLDAVSQVLRIAARHGKVGGFMAGTPELEGLGQHGDLVAVSTDISALMRGMAGIGAADHG